MTIVRQYRQRTFLMCPPRYFDVSYEINAWMDTSVPVDVDRAMQQWEQLRETYAALGHRVHLIEPEPGLPDMVFAANGAFSLNGKVHGACFKHAERAAEAAAHERWYRTEGWEFHASEITNEGEGDFTYVSGRDLILAGHGFRTALDAHREIERSMDRQVISLHLTDPRFYHLDVALFVLGDNDICYYPGAFSDDSIATLQALFPDALLAREEDALAFGLNAVSDGLHVVLPTAATALADCLQGRGYRPITVDLRELLKGGGSVKCCTAELRPAAG